VCCGTRLNNYFDQNSQIKKEQLDLFIKASAPSNAPKGRESFTAPGVIKITPHRSASPKTGLLSGLHPGRVRS
jgi:hypothetical protein